MNHYAPWNPSMPHLLAVSMLTLLLVAGASLDAADGEPLKLSTKEKTEFAKYMNGTFDFTQNPRPYVGVLILDQEGNRYPSYWCGGNVAGTTILSTEYDELDDRIVLEMTGEMTVQMSATPFKKGMEDVLPGGAWIDGLRERKLTVTVSGLEGMTITGVREGNLFVDASIAGAAGADSRLISVEGRFVGRMAVDGHQAAITGPITLTFLDTVNLFSVQCSFPVPAAKLGLSGAAAEGISATFYTASDAVVSRPEAGDMLKDKVPFDLD